MAHLGTRSLLFAVDDIDFSDAVSKVALVAVASQNTRILGTPDFESGGMRDWRLALICAQDAASGSLWDLGWAQSSSQVSFYLAPYGNEIASSSQPHFAGTAIVVGPTGETLGGDASTSPTAVLTADMTWVVLGTPERITDGTWPPAVGG